MSPFAGWDRESWVRAVMEEAAMCKGDVQEDGTGPAKASGPKVEPGLVVSVGDRVLIRQSGSYGDYLSEVIVEGFALEGDGVKWRDLEEVRTNGERRAPGWCLRERVVGIAQRGNPATVSSIRVV